MYAPTTKREFIVSETVFWIMFILFLFNNKVLWLLVVVFVCFFLVKRLKIMPINKLEIMCETYKIMPIFALENIDIPIVAITNPGPDVVQKIDIFFASSSEIKFFS